MHVTKKTGRNELCTCGNGKKYKKCCMAPQNFQNLVDLAWHKIRQTEGEVIDRHLLPYVTSFFPPYIFEMAWDDFLAGEEFPEEVESRLEDDMFIPWFLFNWAPGTFSSDSIPPKKIAQQYLESLEKHALTPYQKQFIEEMCRTVYSYYVVLDVVLDQRLHLKDILLQTEHVIKERSATHTLKRGDVVFARLLALGGQEIAVGMAPYTLKSSEHVTLIDLREDLCHENDVERLSAVHLEEAELELRYLFFDILLAQLNPPPPVLHNTDGELFEPSILSYHLRLPPQEALKKLMPLTLSDEEEEFLEEAERDEDGRIRRIEFSWLKPGNNMHTSWENTVLGHFTIQDDTLRIFVNSANRAQEIRKLIQKHLKEDATYKELVLESLERHTEPISIKNAKREELQDLNDHPDVQHKLQEMAAKQWEDWLTSPLPILSGKTPCQAVETEEGRERVEAVFLDFERLNQRHASPMNPDVGFLRTQLGIEK